MQRIGFSLITAGLLGVPVLAVMETGRVAAPVCAMLWGALGILVPCFGVWRHKGVRYWLDEPLELELAAPPPLLLGVGLAFTAAGIGIIMFGKPSSGPKAMSRE